MSQTDLFLLDLKTIKANVDTCTPDQLKATILILVGFLENLDDVMKVPNDNGRPE